MALSERDRQWVEEFLDYVEGIVAGDDRYGPSARHDHQDESVLAVRFDAGGACYFEVAVRPFVPQVRVAFLTSDRWKNEEIEQAIQDSGDTMAEFVEAAFADARLDWSAPPVEHYRDAGELFYFATPLEVEDVVDLDLSDVRGKVVRMLEGYLIAFGPAIEVEEEAEP